MAHVFAAYDSESFSLTRERLHHAVIEGDPIDRQIIQAARQEIDTAASRRIRVAQCDADALTMREGLDTLHDGVENALEFDGLQQQLVNLRESFKCSELFIEADDTAIEGFNKLARLFGLGQGEHPELPGTQCCQRRRQRLQLRYVRAGEIGGGERCARYGDFQYRC